MLKLHEHPGINENPNNSFVCIEERIARAKSIGSGRVARICDVLWNESFKYALKWSDATEQIVQRRVAQNRRSSLTD